MVSRYLIGFASIFSPWLAFASETPSVDDFARFAEYSSAKLSPDGSKLALIAPAGRSDAIAVIDLDQQKVVSATGFGRSRFIDDFWWADDETLFARPAVSFGSLDRPRATGDLVRFKYNGRGSKFMLGQSSNEQQVGSNIKRNTAEVVGGRIVDRWSGNSRRVIVAVDDLVGDTLGQPRATRVDQMDIQSGRRRTVDVAPDGGYSSILVDSTGRARVAARFDSPTYTVKAQYKSSADADWRGVPTLSDVVPHGLSADDARAYVTANGAGGLDCLYELTLVSGAVRELVCPEDADIARVIFASDTREPLAGISEAGEPQWHWVDTDNAEQQLYQRFARSFSGQVPWPVGTSDDGKRVLLFAYGDKEPGSYYLFDAEAGKIEFLIATRQWIQPQQMAPVESFSFRTADGLTVHGYLTTPPGDAEGPWPAVVMPHGGPLRIRDRWVWDAGAQFLASRGYAVVQVNFRGSGGYGDAFVEAGRRQWATGMIADIDAAVGYLVDADQILPDQLCIVGASYGAFAALTSAVTYPDRYRCVVANAGVYDIELLRKTSDMTDDSEGTAYFSNFVAATEAEAQRASPINRLDRLKAPVLVVHGEEDERTPVDQANALISALRERRHPHETLIKRGEGHGFYDRENRIEYFERMAVFIDAHIAAAQP